jgi:hypothetical protein
LKTNRLSFRGEPDLHDPIKQGCGILLEAECF